jgi:hypothetical protein
MGVFYLMAPPGVVGEVGEANRSGRADHQPQDTVPPRQISDERTLLRIDAVSGKALQEPTIRRQHANGSEPSPDDLGRYLYYALEHPFQGHFGDQRRSGYNQPLQPRAARRPTHRSLRECAVVASPSSFAYSLPAGP